MKRTRRFQLRDGALFLDVQRLSLAAAQAKALTPGDVSVRLSSLADSDSTTVVLSQRGAVRLAEALLEASAVRVELTTEAERRLEALASDRELLSPEVASRV